MGGIGPVPKRSEQRVRRNKPDVPIDRVKMVGEIPVPELGFTDPHPITKDLWESLADSGQAKWYEPSDWHFARVCLHFLDKQLKSEKPSGHMIATLSSMLTDMLVSEGARRRVRMEIERKRTDSDEQEEIATVSDMFRKRLGA